MSFVVQLVAGVACHEPRLKSHIDMLSEQVCPSMRRGEVYAEPPWQRNVSREGLQTMDIHAVFDQWLANGAPAPEQLVQHVPVSLAATCCRPISL